MAKHALCNSCDIFCQVSAEATETGHVGDVRVKAMKEAEFRANICIKGVHAGTGFAHEKRITKPLKRVGERGSGQWQEVSWDEALDDIAVRLQKVIDEYGPEGFGVSQSPSCVQTDSGMSRRFMNHLGAPNWISGVALCMGNTAAINRMVYGWFPWPDYAKTERIFLLGHDPKLHSWTPIYNAIRAMQKRGGKLIVADPMLSENAKQADVHLQLKPGTDAAMLFGMIKVILDEELYDKDFIRDYAHGFEEFRARVDEFPLSRVQEITGIAPETIQKAARMYAEAPAVIPWTPITDQQRNSTTAIRLQCYLRALCGNVDSEGGDLLHGFHRDIISETELEMHHVLSQEQRDKQLGAQKHPAFAYRGLEALREPTKRVWGHEYANQVGMYMAQPTALFRAMAYGDPYPVKAFFAMANNTLMSYPNMQVIYDGIMNQDLVVAFEQFRSPTAQLADYILPSDAWMERNAIADGFGTTAVYRTSQKVVEAPGECRSVYDIWKGLADRMGMSDIFPWDSIDDLYSHRVAALYPSVEEFAAEKRAHGHPHQYHKYKEKGFATPTGKVEFSSTVLDDLGFDPLPYWRDAPADDPNYPLNMFIGVREDEFFQTGHRHIPALRKRNTEPRFFVSPQDAEAAGVADGDWAEVVNPTGKMTARVAVRPDMPQGVLRIPHGWWQPERAEGDGSLSGAWDHADSQICPDDDDHTDWEQGVTQLKGVAARLQPVAQTGADGSAHTDVRAEATEPAE